MKLFGVCIIILLIISGCQSQRSIKRQSIKLTHKEFNIMKQDILKNFRKPTERILYTKPHLMDYLNFAVWNNREIDAGIAELLRLYKDMKSIYYDDPYFDITFAPIYGIFHSRAPLLREFMVSQKFPTAKKLPLERKIMYLQIKAQYFQVLTDMLNIQREVVTNLLLWEKLKKIIMIKRNKLHILNKIKKYLTSSISFQAEKGYFEEIVNINLRVESIKKEIANSKSSVQNIKNQLGRTLYIKNYSNLKIPDLKTLHSLSYQNVIKDFSRNPELLKYKELIKQSELEIDRSTRNFIPDIVLNLGFTLKSMDPVGSVMGKKGLLSSLMLNLPIYREKLMAQIEARVFANYTAKFEFSNKERDLLKNFFNNNIELHLNQSILKIINKQINEVYLLENYLRKLISVGESNLKNNLEVDIVLFDYKEAVIEYEYGEMIANLNNRFLIGKFILGVEK